MSKRQHATATPAVSGSDHIHGVDAAGSSSGTPLQSPPTSANEDARSPLNQYLHEMQERQREAMEKVFRSVVDTSCLGNCGGQQIEDQMDLLMHCRQPLSFFLFFEERTAETEPELPYLGPRSCEYCGSSTTTLCPANCQRPKLYFRKKRPPFAKVQEGWDPVTEYAIIPPAEEVAVRDSEGEKEEHVDIRVQDGPLRSSWVSGLFGGQ